MATATEIVEVKNMVCIGEDYFAINGEERKLNVMVLEDLDEKSWNSLAERTNTRMFIRMTGMQPESYAEVKEWVNGLINDTKKPLL